jgi:hypothetical protein
MAAVFNNMGLSLKDLHSREGPLEEAVVGQSTGWVGLSWSPEHRNHDS